TAPPRRRPSSPATAWVTSHLETAGHKRTRAPARAALCGGPVHWNACADPCALSCCCREVCRLTDGSVALSHSLDHRHWSRLGRRQEGAADGCGAQVPAPHAARAYPTPHHGSLSPLQFDRAWSS